MINLRTCCKIIRLEEHAIYGTFGALLIDSQVFCATLELSDRLNHPNVSSIPPQQYTCRKTSSPKFGQTFEVMDVPSRSGILFHPGNTIDDTMGCILVARNWDDMYLPRNMRGIVDSRPAFDRFMEIMDNVDRFNLTIVEAY